MASIVSGSHCPLVLIWIVGLLLHTSASAQNTQSKREIVGLHSSRRLAEKSLDQNQQDGASFFNVDKYGARGDGRSDDSKAFLAAWTAACTSKSPSVFLVPQGRTYLVNPVNFKGPCSAPHLTFQIPGTVVAPSNPWTPQGQNSWLQLSYLQEITVQGGGTIDGSGQKWWAYKQQGRVNAAPVAMTFSFCQNVILRHLTFQNSPGVHVKLFASTHVKVGHLRINSPEDSPNTDGINIAESKHVVIRDSKIGTGDDCISIIAGTRHLKIIDIECGPGHGISIGSLGKNQARDTVSKVLVRGAHLTGTTNGLRIKSWQGGSGYAKKISYENVRMDKVSNPIIIDQFYCSPAGGCRNQTSAVQVVDVSYKGISGTSATQEAIRLACSNTVPCRNIRMKDINLLTSNGIPLTSFMNSVKGFKLDGHVHPLL